MGVEELADFADFLKIRGGLKSQRAKTRADVIDGCSPLKLYFLAFHIVTVTCILNIFIAFVLEAFILEYTLANVRIRSNLAS